MPFSLQARVVFPVDRPPIERGVVTVAGERIVAVGKAPDGGPVIDLGDVALLPGFVNAHTHLEFSYLQRPLGRPGMSLPDWIRLVIAERQQRAANPCDAIRSGGKESIHHGTTTIADIASVEPHAYLDIPDLLVIFAEVIGFSQARAESAFSATCDRLDGLKRYSHAELGISPHAPYTVSPQLLTRLMALAHTRFLPVAMHLAESQEELELMHSGTGPFRELLEERSMWDGEAIPRGSRPLDYLRSLLNAPRALVIHGNHLDDEERSFLAANADRISLVYCPRTHAYFHHPMYPLGALLAAGVRVALGTDSRASNPNLSLLEEMRYVTQNHPGIDPLTILRAGTLAGAEALGHEWELGSITPGKMANLVAVPLPAATTGDAEVILAAMMGDESPVNAVWVRGRKQ